MALVDLPASQRVIEQTVYTWIASGDFVVDLTLRLDPLAAVMVLVVTGIGALIHIYSTAYMHEEVDSEFARYFWYLNLFAAVHAGAGARRQLPRHVRWMGRCRALFVSAHRVLVQEKIGGRRRKEGFRRQPDWRLCLVLGMLLLAVRFGTLDFRRAGVRRRCSAARDKECSGLCRLRRSCCSSAPPANRRRFPCILWLPDAMEGPTPVSALIHAATMVTAGVYMIGRNAVLFSHAPATMLIVAIIGAADGTHGGARLVWFRTTSSACSRTQRCRSLASCFWPWGWARSAPVFSTSHARVLQGTAVPRFGRRDSCAPRRAGHPQHGRASTVSANHVLDVFDRFARDRRRPRAGWLLQQGRDPVGPTTPATGFCGRWRR